MKPAARLAVSLVLTALFITLFLRGFDLRLAWRALSEASPALIALSALVNLAGYVIRAWRWRFLLAPVRRDLGMYNLTSTTMIGFMISFLVPFRVGEVVRPVLLARRERFGAGPALATIALERLMDVLIVMTLFLAFVLSARGASVLAPSAAGGQAALLLRRGVLAAALFVLIGLPLLAVLVAIPGRVVALLHRLNPGHRTGPVGRAIGSLETFVQGLDVLRRPRDLAPCLAVSLALWLALDLSVFLGVRAFGLGLRYTDIFLLMLPLGIGIAVPTPGGVGPYEYLGQTSLTGFFGVPAAVAGATAITLHAITIVPTIAVGLFFMWRDGLKPSEVRRMAALQDAAAPGEGAS